jgi:membrane protein YdbS with pleckstrin-like domain/DNA-directed RNA polymerase subunit RPC12/RpoP
MSDIRFKCPECKGDLSVDESGAGMTVPCPHCSEQITIPTPQRNIRASSPDDLDERIPCLFCGEPILASAVKCKHCSEYQDGRTKEAPKKPKAKMLPEVDLWQGHPSYLKYFLHFVFGIILLPLLGTGLLFIIYALLDRNTRVYTLTSKRAMAKVGIISRTVHEVAIRDVKNINVKQGIIDRIFNLGTVEISSAGSSGIEVTFYGIKNPMPIRDKVRREKDELDND